MNILNNISVTTPNAEWTDEQWAAFRTWLVNLLKVATVTVTFNKKDGEQRVMTCSLQPELLPVTELKESTKEKKENLNIISVYDLTARGWRSFTVKNVTSIH